MRTRIKRQRETFIGSTSSKDTKRRVFYYSCNNKRFKRESYEEIITCTYFKRAGVQ